MSGLTGAVPGYVTDRTMAARDAIQPLELAYFFASIESSGKIVFRHRGRADAAMTLGPDDFVESGDALYELTRAQETDLPAFAKVRYISSVDDYPQAVAAARRLTSSSGRVAEADLPIVLDDGLAGTIVESWLYETWATRESATFKLPPSTLALEPGDIVSANIGGRSRLLRLTDVSEHAVRDIQALSIDPSVYDQIDVAAAHAVAACAGPNRLARRRSDGFAAVERHSRCAVRLRGRNAEALAWKRRRLLFTAGHRVSAQGNRRRAGNARRDPR